MSTPEGEPITAEGLEKLKAELHELETTARQDIAKRILFAREMGDLSENAEYHIAKEDQAHLETKIARLVERLRNAVVTETDAGASVVTFGSTVTIFDEAAAREQTWTLVGPTEASVADGRLSSESPIAQALIGRAPGDTVEAQTPRGARRLRIERLGT
jgi:transcription elongation factor GreA